uniref:Uncharacterized protein n=1 Tax=Oryza punctata TaxID=4537 RepID=A0A0E0MAP0_ORYPU
MYKNILPLCLMNTRWNPGRSSSSTAATHAMSSACLALHRPRKSSELNLKVTNPLINYERYEH